MEFEAVKTHCNHGHLFDAANTYISPRGVRNCRICAKIASKAHRRRHKDDLPSPEKARTFMAALREGQTIREITWGQKIIKKVPIHVGPRIISGDEIRALKNSSPKIAKIINDLVKKNVTEVKRVNMRSRHAAVRVRTASITKAGVIGFEAIMSVTASLPDYLRDDVRQAMLLASATGSLRASDVRARLREFVSQQNKFYSKYVPVVGGVMHSLDAPIYDDNSSSLIERVTEGLWG